MGEGRGTSKINGVVGLWYKKRKEEKSPSGRPMEEGHTRVAGGSNRAASHFVCMEGFPDACFNGHTTNALIL